MGRRLRAIDLYAGVGGWAVGLKMAGIDLVRSYEWWKPAASTHHANSASDVTLTDIRKLEVTQLPSDIDLVVGSPPCTQFSFSNRGGSGDISDGLEDIKCFLNVIRYLEPKYWAFENVPRVKRVLETELRDGNALDEYKDLLETARIDVFDMADFGVPQRRKRCIVGNFDFEILHSYSTLMVENTLGNVIEKISNGMDPCYLNSDALEIFDNEKEAPLSWEEERFNRDMKMAHPVYNGMPFPDPLDRTSRTVTATCTRVSRESLVILDSKSERYRRLSVRERASLQSFPATFQFLGKSHAEKLKMIGNAIPPIFTYLVAEAIKNTKPRNLKLPSKIDANGILPKAEPIPTRPDTAGKTYPSNRRFRFAIPNLRFKSGTRFELANIDGPDEWGVAFYFGDSKRINRRNPSTQGVLSAAESISLDLTTSVKNLHEKTLDAINDFDLTNLQSTWVRKSEGTHPFAVIDQLGSVAKSEMEEGQWYELPEAEIKGFVYHEVYGPREVPVLAKHKISSLAVSIAIGMIISAAANQSLQSEKQRKIAAE